MIVIIKNKKAATITVIILAVLLLIFTGAYIYIHNTINCSMKVSIREVNTTQEILKNKYGLSEDQVDDISNNPESYREIYCTGIVDNRCGLALYDVGFCGSLPKNILTNNKFRLITDDKPKLNISNNRKSDIACSFIVCVGDKNNTEILDDLKKGKIYLTGKPGNISLRLKLRAELKCDTD